MIDSHNSFLPLSDFPTVYFDSHEISKPDSSSFLTQMDGDFSPMSERGSPKREILDLIVNEVRTKLGLALFGIDVIIEKGSGRYAIIDMNVFPGNWFNLIYSGHRLIIYTCLCSLICFPFSCLRL